MIGAIKKQDVVIQSSLLPIFQRFAINESAADISLASDAVVDDSTVTVTTGHGITTDNIIVISSGARFDQFTVTGVAGNDISLNMPVAFAFPSGSKVIAGSRAMNVNGSVTPVAFKFKPRTTKPVDVSYFVVSMVHAAEADDSKFGGITALTNGVYARMSDGMTFNLGNFKNNRDFGRFGAQVSYTSKAGGGAYGTNVIFDLRDVFTQELRIDPRQDDELLFVVRDDLSAFSTMTISILGSYTSGE